MIIKHSILMTIIYELTGGYTCCFIPTLQCKKHKLTKAVDLCFFVLLIVVIVSLKEANSNRVNENKRG